MKSEIIEWISIEFGPLWEEVDLILVRMGPT